MSYNLTWRWFCWQSQCWMLRVQCCHHFECSLNVRWKYNLVNSGTCFHNMESHGESSKDNENFSVVQNANSSSNKIINYENTSEDILDLRPRSRSYQDSSAYPPGQFRPLSTDWISSSLLTWIINWEFTKVYLQKVHFQYRKNRQ